MASVPEPNQRPVWDFHGGVHPPENKDQSNAAPIRPGPMPRQLVLPLNMHIGAPADPIVEVGDRVLKGQVIAEPHGPISSAIHAPTSGTVTAIGERPIQHPSGLEAECIVIEPDGRDEWGEKKPWPNWRSEDPHQLLQRLQCTGLAGLGGAGFPTAAKLNLRDDMMIEQLVINAVECEPYITADDRLMRERAPAIIEGIEILAHLIQPKEILVGIEDNKPEAIDAMRDAARGTKIEIIVVPTKYPSGGEKQLIQLLTGKEVDAGGLPAHVGVVCQNVGTAYAVQRSLVEGEPLLSRITTLTGDAFERPGNYEVLIGTPVAELLEHGGAPLEKIGRLVMGGPMMGFTMHTPAAPVVKTTNCIIAATAEELPEPPPEQPCIRCGSCAEVCPANLLPQQLYWYSKNDEFERARHYNLMDCIECGACAYVCPSHIPLVQYYRYAKGEVRQQAAEHAKADRARRRFEARQERIEKEKAEREARKQVRLEANRQKQAQAAAGSTAPAADLDALKKTMKEASANYKAAVKELKAAETEGADNIDELRARVDELKGRADEAKAAVRDAKAAGGGSAPAQPVQDDAAEKLAALKKEVGDASKAYKAAVKDAKAAEEEGRDEAGELRARADELKAKADELKAQLREAKATAPQAATAAPPAQKQDDGKDEAAERAKKMKALKTAYNMANKHWKEAKAAFEKAERDGAGNLEELQKKVDKLRFKADKAREGLDALVEEAKAGVQEKTGTDLKTLKIEAARAEKAAREKASELEDARESDPDKAQALEKELAELRQAADEASAHLKKVMDEQGMKEDA